MAKKTDSTFNNDLHNSGAAGFFLANGEQEMKLLMQREKESQKMLEEAFKGIGYGIE